MNVQRFFIPRLIFPLPIFADSGLSDIRDIAEYPTLWPWIVAAITILLLAGFFLWRRRTPPASQSTPEPVEPPDIKALRLLQQLREQGDELEAEVFTVEVSSILRNYLEDALNLPAPEQTSEEFLQDLRAQSWLTPDLQQDLEEFMRLADLVKFARQALNTVQRQRLLESARQVIETTRPQPEPVAS